MDFKSSKLPRNALPTHRDIIEAINYEKVKNKKTYKNAISAVVNDLISVWERTSVPHVTKRSITGRIEHYRSKYKQLANGDHRRLNYVHKVQQFKVIYI